MSIVSDALVLFCKTCGIPLPATRSRRHSYNKGRRSFVCPSCHPYATPFEQRFWAKVDKTPGHGPQGDCWLWTASTNQNGYGHLVVEGHLKQSHHIAWFLETGQWLLKGLELCHSCDMRRCVRFRHLFEGTHQDNIDDMMRKGRNRHPCGEHAGASKLLSEQVLSIRHLYGVGELNQAQLALRFNVNQETIGRIIRRQTWKHI